MEWKGYGITWAFHGQQTGLVQLLVPMDLICSKGDVLTIQLRNLTGF
jgi:hypothetical protein